MKHSKLKSLLPELYLLIILTVILFYGTLGGFYGTLGGQASAPQTAEPQPASPQPIGQTSSQTDQQLSGISGSSGISTDPGDIQLPEPPAPHTAARRFGWSPPAPPPRTTPQVEPPEQSGSLEPQRSERFELVGTIRTGGQHTMLYIRDNSAGHVMAVPSGGSTSEWQHSDSYRNTSAHVLYNEHEAHIVRQ